MINNRLRAGATVENLLVQFSKETLPNVLNNYMENLKEEKVLIRRTNLQVNIINFYLISEKKTVQYQQVSLNKVPSDIKFALTLIYINTNEEDKYFEQPEKKTLLLREGLQTRFSLSYDVEQTITQQDSLVFLCNLSAALINYHYESQKQSYDGLQQRQLTEKQMTQLVKTTWKNILFQIPGIGKDKIPAIVKQFPTYKSILEDYVGQQKLSKVEVPRGNKTCKLGTMLANRIYKVMTSMNSYQSIMNIQ